jgi:hypothetical protein
MSGLESRNRLLVWPIAAHPMEVDMSTNAPVSSAPAEAASDPLLGAITDALDQLQQEEYDPEVLAAASAVTGEDMSSAWRPPLGFVSPHKDRNVYRVSVFANMACSNSPRSHSAIPDESRVTS